MEKNTKAYIVVDLGIAVPEESHEEYGLKQLDCGKLNLRNIVSTVQIAAEDIETLVSNELNSLSYEEVLIYFNDKYWTFNLDSALGVCAAGVLGACMSSSMVVLDEDKTFDAGLIIEALNSYKGKPIIDALLGAVNATLTTSDSRVRTLCWENVTTTPLSLLLDELGNVKNSTVLRYAEINTGTLTRSFYNYVDGCESFLVGTKEIPITDPAFPVRNCYSEGAPVDIRMLLSNIEGPHHHGTRRIAGVATEPKGVRLSDFDTPNFMSQDTRDGIRRTARTVESMRDRLKSRDSRDRRLAQYEELENDVYSIVRDLKRVFDGVNRILLDMDNNVPASAALAVTTIVEEGVKEIQRLVSGARKDTLIGMLENEISMGRGNSSFNLKDELLELLDDRERTDSDRRGRRRVRSGYRGWAEVDCKRRDCDCEHCQYERRSPRDDRDEDDDRRDRRSSRHHRTRY